MAYTAQVTFDNLSLHALTAPVDCRRITLRELASDTAPVAYNVAAPANTNPTFPKYPAESTVFEASPGAYIQAGATVGYIQPTSGTVTFSLICE